VTAMETAEGTRTSAVGRGWLFALAGATLALDQLTKCWVAAVVPLGSSRPQTSFFTLTHTTNTGAALGWLRSYPAVLIGVQMLATLVVAYICWRGALRRRYLAVGLAMVLGGAAGNLVDRLARGHVVDFIKLHAGSFAWPDFNVADIGVTVGALLVAGYLYFGLPHDQPAEDTESDRWDDADDADAQSALVECAGSSEDSLETAGPGPSAPTAGHAEPSTPCPASD